MLTLEKFLAATEVSMRCHEIQNGDREQVLTEPWAATHYECELHGSNGDRPVTTVVGSDNGPPEIDEVLDTLAAEAAVAEEAEGFEAWAERMGYDPDSRRAERVYRAEVRQAKLLRKLLGENRFRRLLWETERL